MLQQYPHAAHHPYLVTLLLVNNVAVILSDVLAFLAVIYQVWGLWKEKRRLGLHTGKDFASLLLQQVLVTVSGVIIDYISPVARADVAISQHVYEISYNTFETAYVCLLPLRFSAILICEFTLDLRQRNTTARSLPNQSAIEFRDLNLSFQDNPVRSIQSVFGRFQEGIIADMGERGDLVGIDTPGRGKPDLETA
ncbi:hypothetical protein Clacol_004678 [Clathrus columnatus]|uniref:Uncharacterized protein n=1 Tax=Clathrus columnatus TaxID=1419009 RepID=A0AAV5AA49_9AGAM|nr:hypothetical protein Clacol_004678 [Clathrus columnatus]